MKIIGLFGKPRAGKNEMVKSFEAAGFINISISTSIKAESHKISQWPFVEAEKDIPQARLNGRTPRDLYVHMGTLDTFIPSFWVSHAGDEMEHYLIARDGHANFVIESVGRQVQWDYLLQRFGALYPMHLIGIDRPGCEWDNREVIQDYETPSIVHNDGSLSDYHVLCDQVVETVAGWNEPRSAHDLKAWFNRKSVM